jgi:signal transduction histidine kinase
MHPFRDLPIRVKLLVMGLIASGSALVLASLAFVLNDQAAIREQIVARLSAQAEIIGAGVAPAVMFQDPEAAEQTLDALRAEPHVTAALLLDAEGRQVAQYRRARDARLPQLVDGLAPLRHRFGQDDVRLTHRIDVDGRHVATLTIASDLEEIRESVRGTMVLAAGVFAVSMLLALGVSGWLARSIARPVLDLVRLTRRVSEEQDYSMRPAVPADGAGRDEVGLLVRSVSGMLDEIEARDDKLESARLEVEQRNSALEESSAQLLHEVQVRRAAEKALEVHAQELARSNAELEQFAYVASHDLQEPLRMVSGFVDLLAEEHGASLPPEAKEYIAFALEGTHRMHALIQDLLAYSRVGSRTEKFAPVSLEKVVGEVLFDLQAAVKDAGAEITHDPLPTVMGEPLQLRQVLQNLLSNAIKFRGAEPPRIHVSAGRDDGTGEWLVSISDNGIGIDPKHADKVFVIFQRLHSREAYPGTGIGLAICKKIVERHGGRIWVEGEPGKGSTFKLALPAAEA